MQVGVAVDLPRNGMFATQRGQWFSIAALFDPEKDVAADRAEFGRCIFLVGLFVLQASISKSVVVWSLSIPFHFIDTIPKW